jgi:hypothetical protein
LQKIFAAITQGKTKFIRSAVVLAL